MYADAGVAVHDQLFGKMSEIRGASLIDSLLQVGVHDVFVIGQGYACGIACLRFMFVVDRKVYHGRNRYGVLVGSHHGYRFARGGDVHIGVSVHPPIKRIGLVADEVAYDGVIRHLGALVPFVFDEGVLIHGRQSELLGKGAVYVAVLGRPNTGHRSLLEADDLRTGLCGGAKGRHPRYAESDDGDVCVQFFLYVVGIDFGRGRGPWIRGAPGTGCQPIGPLCRIRGSAG